MHVRRAKGGQEATHPLLGDELRALRELKRQSASPFVFASERGGPGFAKLLARAGAEAKIGFKVHPHSSGMPAATHSPTRASIPEHCRPISAIARSIRPRATPRWLRAGSRTFGGRHKSAKSGREQPQQKSLYSITSSARPDRLMINSTLVACWTGRSAGFAPSRTRAAYPRMNPASSGDGSAVSM
jgi:hypothetical protein